MTELKVKQGTTWSYDWAFTDVSGSPVDLSTGYEAHAQLRRRPSDAFLLYEWSSDTANCDLTADGRIVLTLEPAETSLWSFRRAVWDLEVTDPDGVVTRLDEGTLELLPEVTR